MDMLLTAAADALARRAMIAEHRLSTPVDEDAYYARYTLNVIVPAWVPALFALLSHNRRSVPRRISATRHA